MKLFPYAEHRWEGTSPSLVMSGGPDRVVTDAPPAPGETMPRPVGFHRKSPCEIRGCKGKRCNGRHDAVVGGRPGLAPSEHPLRQTTEAISSTPERGGRHTR